MRITFVLPTIGLGGGIKVVAIHAKALRSRGHEVTLVSPPPPDPSFRSRLRAFLGGGGWGTNAAIPASHLDESGLNHRRLDRWRPVTNDDVPDADVVIATWWETAEWVAALDPNKGAKVYFIQHHEVFPYLPVSRCHATYRLPMHKIVVARWLKEVMINQYGDDIVDIVPNSVDRAQFFSAVRGKQATPTVGFLYAPAPFKGLDVVLTAISAVQERIPNLRLTCFGSMPPTEDFPLPKSAEFVLCPPQDQIRDLYSQCDVWVTASRSEGFNLPAIEAMACRTPIVATRTGWPGEAIESGRNGVLVDVNDAEGLACGIEWTLSLSSDVWKSLSQCAYETACAGSWDDSTRKFERALLRACRRSMNGEIGGKCGCAL